MDPNESGFDTIIVAKMIADNRKAKTKESYKEDYNLAVRASAGERLAMTELAERLLDPIRTTVRFISGDSSDQDDWSQQAIMEVLRSIGSYRGESALTTWANRIVVRKVMKLAKKDRRRQRLMHVFQRLSPYDDVALPEESDTALLRRHLAQAFSKLPVKYRTVMTLRLVHQAGLTEITEVVGIPKNTVRQRLRRGKKLLRDKVSKDRVLREFLEEMEQ